MVDKKRVELVALTVFVTLLIAGIGAGVYTNMTGNITINPCGRLVDIPSCLAIDDFEECNWCSEQNFCYSDYECVDSCGQTCETELPQVCGNGILEGTEACDDGNTVSRDGCSNCIIDVITITPAQQMADLIAEFESAIKSGALLDKTKNSGQTKSARNLMNQTKIALTSVPIDRCTACSKLPIIKDRFNQDKYTLLFTGSAIGKLTELINALMQRTEVYCNDPSLVCE